MYGARCIRLLAVVVWTTASLIAHGADFNQDSAVKTWAKVDGLPADSVTAIIQTRDGFLWVGTSGGLVRFDGVKFTEILFADLPRGGPVCITALCEDNYGHLWVGTQQNGLFEMRKERPRHFTRAHGLLDDGVTSLATDNQGRVWIGTKAGLNLSAGDAFKSFTTKDGLPDELVIAVHAARSGAVWITTRGGMCRTKGKEEMGSEKGEMGSERTEVSDLALRTSHFTLHTPDLMEGQGRSPEYLGAYEDRRGNVWAYGDTYLINLAEKDKRFNYFRGNEARIWSFYEGRDGRLWIGTSGRGLFSFDERGFQPVSLGELRWPYDVRAICEDREGNLWLGTTGGGLVQLRVQPVRIVDAGQGLPSRAASALAVDAGGRVLVGLRQGGLFVGEGGRFEPLAGGGEVQDYVSSLGIGRDGTVWAGTLGGGLYGVANGRCAQFTTANGLADDMVLSVCADSEGTIWASTGGD